MKKLSTATIIAILMALLVATVALALLTNGDFEAGNFSGWTKDATYLSGGINVGPPSSYIPVAVASVAGATVTDRTFIVDTAWMDTKFGTGQTCDPVTDGTILGTGEVCLPHNGTNSAVVNYQGKYSAPGAKSNMNTLTQSGVVASGDIAADGNYHIYFAYAPVLDKGSHSAADQPFMYVRLIRVRAGSPDKTLFDKFSYPADLNPNWKISKTTTSVYYMNWQTYDLSYSPAELNAGDSLTIEVTAAGCSYTNGGHWGYVYVDDFGPAAPTGNTAPSITSLAPTFDGIAGGAVVTLVGERFTNATAVTVDTTVLTEGTGAGTFQIVDDNHITFDAPAHVVGAVDVSVTNPSGSGLLASGFTYIGLPTITGGASGGGTAPDFGPVTGGTSVVISGTNLSGSTFMFDGTTVACVVNFAGTQATCTSPAHSAGAVDVIVTNSLGSDTSLGGFLYVDPTSNWDRDTVGVFRPSNGNLFLKNDHITGPADISITYGLPGDYPLKGDWDGNGTDTIGVYRNGVFYLRNSNATGVAEISFAFGMPGDQPVAGDWDGDGIDTIGVYRSSTVTFYLRNSLSSGAPDHSFQLGLPGDVGLAGDWTGKGFDTVGVYRPSNGVMYLQNSHTGGFAEIALNYGLAGDKPVTGDWNNDGIDTIGVLRNDGRFYLKNANTVGFADIIVGLGNPGDLPIAGNWDALP